MKCRHLGAVMFYWHNFMEMLRVQFSYKWIDSVNDCLLFIEWPRLRTKRELIIATNGCKLSRIQHDIDNLTILECAIFRLDRSIKFQCVRKLNSNPSFRINFHLNVNLCLCMLCACGKGLKSNSTEARGW